MGDSSQDRLIARKLKSCDPPKGSLMNAIRLAKKIGRTRILKNKEGGTTSHFAERGNRAATIAPKIGKIAIRDRIQLSPRRAIPATQDVVAASKRMFVGKI
jgi:hypothetical protein